MIAVYVSLSILLLVSFTVSVEYQRVYTVPSDCPTGTFYDISHLKCEQCNGENTEPSTDKLSCVCKQGYKKVSHYGGIDTKCTPCPAGQLPTPDGWQCAECIRPLLPNATSSPQSNICPDTCNLPDKPGYSSISLSINTTGSPYSTMTCVQCERNTVAAQSRITDIQYCEPCNPGLEGGTCPCAGEQSGGLCFKSGTLVPGNNDLFVISYEPNNDRVTSQYFQEYIRAADYMCRAHKNFTACQLLANLCVLLHYENVDSRTGKAETACDLYAAITAGPNQGTPNPWPAWMPFISYPVEEASTVLTKSDFDVSYSFDDHNPMAILNFTAAIYSLNGTFLGLAPLTAGLIQLCQAEDDVLDAAYRFGRKYRQTCQISVRQILQRSDLRFFDIYLVYPNNKDDKLSMYTIPVLNLNLINNGQKVNKLDERHWQFSRRLFLVDGVAAKEKGASGADAKLKYIRYAKYIGIFIKLKNTKDGKVYPPHIKIEYADVKMDGVSAGTTVPVEFEVTYSMDTSRHEKDVEITMSTLCSFGALWALLKAWSWSRRSGKAAIDLVTIFKFLIYLACTISNIFLIVLLFSCGWILILYKCQRKPVVMILTPEQEYSFLVYFGMAIALKTVELVNLLAEQVTSKVFFVDWERPRGYIIPRTGEMGTENGTTGKTLAPVSIWRTYIVANEWNELQTYRKTSYVLQQLMIILLLKVVTLENLALVEPGATLGPVPGVYQDSRMSRFAVGSLAYLCIGFMQWMINVFIVERCINDHFRNFIDLCSISNVSVIALPYRQYGYYIHGRSVHGHADTNMREMNEMLQRERENMCTQRGLEPNSDHQCFIGNFSNKFRIQYDRILGAPKPHNRSMARSSHPDEISGQPEQVTDVYGQINQFMCTYIDHLVPDNDYVVKDRRFLESVLDMEFEDSSQNGIFHRDPSETSFTRVLLYGNEWTLLTFDTLIFCLTDLLAHDFLIAALVTYVMASCIRYFRSMGGKRNIIKTAFIDERFLI